jgi:hypothetical protein
VCITVILPAVLALAWAAQAPDAPQEPLELRGRVVCLDAADQPRACGPAPHRFALDAADGRVHPFLPADALAGIFEDPRIRASELVVRARAAARDAVEIIKVFTVKDGVRHDAYYYCDVCHITAYVPGRCPCCGRDMELRETPLPSPVAQGQDGSAEGRHER